MSCFRRFIFVLFLVVILTYPITLLAQYGTGTIIGTVLDPSNAVVPGVRVTAKNSATNETRTFTTDSSGEYRFNALLTGTYAISAAAPSFRTATIPDVELLVNTQVRVDIRMQVGSISETVEVTAATPQLQTTSAALGTVITQRVMLELPLNTRNFFDLVKLTPGTVKLTSGGSTVMDGNTAQIAGTRYLSTNYMLDGVDFGVTNLSSPAISLSLDMIDEFKVQENFMDASYGHGGGGLDMVTRRGTNAFHGGAYDFVRNRAFQAGQFFRPSSGAPRFSYNQFGADGGGPIRKDKTFFFVHYEGRRRRTGVILQGLVPTLDMQAGNFTGTGVNIKDPLNNNQSFPGNSIPASRFDPVAAKLLQYFPAPNFINQRPGINYLVAPSDWERRDQTTGRIDHRLSDKGSLFGRYSLADDALANVDYRPGVGLIRPDRTQYVVAGYTHLFSPTLISETRLGFLKCFTARYNDGDTTSTNLSQQAGLKNLSAVPGEYSNPTIRLTGYSPGSPTDGSTPSFVGYAFGSTQVQNNEYYRMAETITNVRGKHNLKIGGDFSRLLVGYEQGGSQNGVLSFSGNFTGNAFGDYLLGFPLSASGGLGDVGNVGRVAKYTFSSQFQAFVQDDWRITDKLVLNLGLRYEFFLPVRGRLANFDLATGRQLIAGSADYFVPGVGLVKGTGPALLPERPQSADWNNFAPRLGIAYRLGEKTSIRAGGGVFYALNGGQTTFDTMAMTAPFYVTASLTSSSTVPQLAMSTLFPSAIQTPASVSQNHDLGARTGYIYQYNLSLQRQVRPGLLVESGYIGNTAMKQQGTVNVNQPRLPSDPANPSPVTTRMPYPALVATFSQVSNYQWSDYNAGFVKLEQRAKSGLSYSFAYTYSKMMDSGGAGQNMYNRQPEHERSSTDVPQVFLASYVYDLPIGKGKALNIQNWLLDGLAGGWEISGITTFQSGMYFSIGTSGDIAGVSTSGQRGNATGVKPSKLDPRTNGLLGFDRSAYSTPAKGTFGNLGANIQHGFGLDQWDVGIHKNFPIRRLGEASRLQIRAEWFNFVNHAEFNNPASTVNVPTSFGLVSSALDPRILQVAAKLYW